MNVKSTPRFDLPTWAGWFIALGAIGGLAATYWDSSWHTTLGRDSTFAYPHLLLYASILIVGGVLAVWILCTLLIARSIRGALSSPGLLLATAGGLVTALAAPIDAIWHSAFGRDSVLWSPPHLISVLGTITLLIASMIALSGRASTALNAVLSAALLGATQVVVLEYDTAVPQFGEALYVPLLLATSLAAVWISREVGVSWLSLMYGLGFYFLFRALTFVSLSIPGWVAPDLPLALLGLLAFVLPIKRTNVKWLVAAASMVLLQAAASASGISSVLLSAVVPSSLGTFLFLGVIAVVTMAKRRGMAIAALLAVSAFGAFEAPPPAQAHDPGQGDIVRTVQFATKALGGGTVAVEITVIEGQPEAWQPVGLVARRAGETVRAGLTVSPNQSGFQGEIQLPSAGLWFVYAELQNDAQRVEAWIPVEADGDAKSETRPLYVPVGTGPSSPLEYVAGAVLYLIGAGLLAGAARETRRYRNRSVSR